MHKKDLNQDRIECDYILLALTNMGAIPESISLFIQTFFSNERVKISMNVDLIESFFLTRSIKEDYPQIFLLGWYIRRTTIIFSYFMQ